MKPVPGLPGWCVDNPDFTRNRHSGRAVAVRVKEIVSREQCYETGARMASGMVH